MTRFEGQLIHWRAPTDQLAFAPGANTNQIFGATTKQSGVQLAFKHQSFFATFRVAPINRLAFAPGANTNRLIGAHHLLIGVRV